MTNDAVMYAYGTGVFPVLILGTARGSQASPTATQDNDVLGKINFDGYSTARQVGAQIRAVSAGVWGQGSELLDTPAEMIFSVGNDVTPTAPIDVLILHSDSSVEIPFSLNVGANSNFGADIEVAGQLLILDDEDRPEIVGDPGAVAILGADGRLTWHDDTSGDLLGYITANGIEGPVAQDWQLESGPAPILDYLANDCHIGLNLGHASDDPETALHVTNGPAGFIGGMIFDAFVMTSGSTHTILSGTGLSANVDICFHGQAIIQQVFGGSGLQTVTLTVYSGSTQVVATDGSNSITFACSSGVLTVARSAGTGHFHVAMMGVFM